MEKYCAPAGRCLVTPQPRRRHTCGGQSVCSTGHQLHIEVCQLTAPNLTLYERDADASKKPLCPIALT
jgi:hypothetical protein